VYGTVMRRVHGQSRVTIVVAAVVLTLLATLLLSSGGEARASSSPKFAAQVRNVIIASHEDFLHKSFKAECSLLSLAARKFYDGLFSRSTCVSALASDYRQTASTPEFRKITATLLGSEIASDRTAQVSLRGSRATLTEYESSPVRRYHYGICVADYLAVAGVAYRGLQQLKLDFL